ncbi:MAG TPA: PQQ-dependent sugar dehydrogenase [Nitrospira sp.]|nr:PQQ-dependent sugar dehydrogenase [Nitrospira sp.]
MAHSLVTVFMGLAVVLCLIADRTPTAIAAEVLIRSAETGIELAPVVAHGLQAPLFLTHAGDGSGQLFVVEQGGTVRSIVGGILQDFPFLDLRDRLWTKGNEQGLLGLTFHPDHQKNGRLFANYNRKEDGATVVAEYTRRGRSLQVSSETERILMVVPQPYLNHNGGMITFGPDGFLYIGRGDGGSKGDPQNRAQNLQELLGKILRIDVDRGRPYAIPPENPFASGGGRPEIFAFGIRNPWRFSFDRETGMLWLADVGQWKWEEIDLVVAGGNYGWRIMEGAHCYNPEEGCSPEGLIFPIAEYGHEEGRCSITGGYVYRGSAVPGLRGTYLFGDYCSGELFALSASANRRGSAVPRILMRTGLRISSFGEDEAGEVYVVDHRGALYRLAAGGSVPTR